MKIKGIIFDCDGVIIDSRHANIAYYNKLLVKAGYSEMTKAQEDFVHMASNQQAIEHIFTKETAEEIAKIAQGVTYKDVVLPVLELEPGIMECLSYLKENNYKIAVNTNRGSGMHDVIEHFSLQGIFDPVITVDVAKAKPSPDGVFKILEKWQLNADEVIFIGDSLTDCLAARDSGVGFLAYKNFELNSIKCIDNFSELVNYIKNSG